MDPHRLRALKALSLFEHVPEDRLTLLAEYLKPRELGDGGVVFEEDSPGRSLFFVAEGHVRISKRTTGAGRKDLAILGPGDCFGEMALLEPAARSARAAAQGPALVFELGKDDLDRWLKAMPDLAVGFFAELVQVLSGRLRRTSTELTLLTDVADLLALPYRSPTELFGKVLARVVPHLEGDWDAAAYLHNVFNGDLELAAREGGFDFAPVVPRATATSTSAGSWLDGGVFHAPLPGARRSYGFMLFRPAGPLAEDARREFGRTLEALARLLVSALENVNFRTEDQLRERLKSTQSYGSEL